MLSNVKIFIVPCNKVSSYSRPMQENELLKLCDQLRLSPNTVSHSHNRILNHTIFFTLIARLHELG
jgi:hypothetical protein